MSIHYRIKPVALHFLPPPEKASPFKLNWTQISTKRTELNQKKISMNSHSRAKNSMVNGTTLSLHATHKI